MKHDIQSRQDIYALVKLFYDKLLADPSVQHFFTEATDTHLHLEEHFETLCNFWEFILLNKDSGYRGNMMWKHLDFHRKSPMNHDHFSAWLTHWKMSLHELFEGPVADHAFERAMNLAMMMEYKATGNVLPHGDQTSTPNNP